MMTTRFKIFCTGLLLLLFCFCSGAPSDETPSAKREDVVGQAFAALAAAYNAADANAIAALFTPRGEFIDASDNVFQGRETIAREFVALFEINPRNKIRITADDIREISPGVLSVDGTASFPGAERSDDADVDFGALFIRQTDGHWLVASLRSEGETSLRTPHARLKALEWLIGEWVDESDESTMQTSTRWSDDGQFLLTDFTIHVAGHKVMHGTQRIGWDGSLEKFRSWVFDSEGGHVEGIWTEIDHRWVVKAAGVRPDGDACSATQTYEPRGTDSYLFTVTDRIIGDESAADFTATVVRKPPEPAKPKAAPAPSGK